MCIRDRPYNDYIFSIICEELGIFGAGLVILLFIFLLYRIYTISQTAEDMLGRMLTIGVFSHIALQVILNLLVVTGLFPTTGVTLSLIHIWPHGWHQSGTGGG